MTKTAAPRLAFASLLTGGLLTAIFAGLLIPFRNELQTEIRQKIIERDAAVLHPVALQQLAEVSARAIDSPGDAEQLTPVLRSAQQEGMLAVAVFDAQGRPAHSVPASVLFVELPVEDYLELTNLKPLSRYHADFDLNQTFAGIAPTQSHAPVLEVLLPLYFGAGSKLAGVARYYIDARPLARELDLIDAQIKRQTNATIALAAGLIALIVTAAYLGLRRSQRQLAERNERLIRVNFELTLAAKASALGQITSHLIHGLQGSVAGLRAVVSHRGEGSSSDWATAADYTERMQIMIEEAVSLLGDSDSRTSYELTGRELTSTIRKRNQHSAAEKGVVFEVNDGFSSIIDSHRGSLVCLIANNLVQNAIAATETGHRVSVSLVATVDTISLAVQDEGAGIPNSVQEHLFKPGQSGRNGGSGLGLAISQLLARQIGADLILHSTSPAGTCFRLSMPLVNH